MQTFSVSDFGGGLNTAVDEALLPSNMTASCSNVDITDTLAVTKRKGFAYISATICATHVKQNWRYYQVDGDKYRLCVLGTAVYSQGVTTTAPPGVAEAEDTLLAASSTSWAQVSKTILSHGAAARTGTAGAVARFDVPSCTQFLTRLILNAGGAGQTVSASLRIDSGAWQSITGTNQVGDFPSPEVPVSVYRTYSGLAPSTHRVYLKGAASPSTAGWYLWADFFYHTSVSATGWTNNHGNISASTDVVGFATLNNKTYLATPYDRLMSFDGATLSNVSATPPYASFLETFNRRLFAAGDPSNPSRLYYSDLDAPETNIGVNYWQIGDKDAGAECTGLKVFRDRLFWLSQNRICALDVIGDPVQWQRKTLPMSEGCVAPKSACVGPNHLVWLSQHSVWALDAQGTAIDLGRWIRPTIEGITTPSSCVGAYYDDRYWLACALDGSANTSMLVYKFPQGDRPGCWTRYDLPIAVTSMFVTRADEYGLFAGTSTGKLVQLDTGTTDGASAISWHYRIPPIAPKGKASVKHFRRTYLTARSPQAQSLTVAPTTDDVYPASTEVSVDAKTDIQPVRIQTPARGRSVAYRLSGEGSAQDIDISELTVAFTPPKLR